MSLVFLCWKEKEHLTGKNKSDVPGDLCVGKKKSI